MEFEHGPEDMTVPNTPNCKGRFEVMECGKGRHINKYVCKRTDVTTDNSRYYIDMGYVQKKLLHAIFPIT